MSTVLDFWDEMTMLERRMDEIVRQFLGTRTRLAYPTLPLFVRKPFVPTMDVFERDEDLVIKLELPGIDPKEDVAVEVRDHMLVVKGERKQVEEMEEEAYYRMEASYGGFERQIPIPEDVSEEEITATYTDGVLEVVVPKAAKQLESPETRRIPVLTEKEPAKAA